MKRVLSTIIILATIFSLTSCNGKDSDETENFLIGKIYMNNTPGLQSTLDFDFVKFYDDNTFQAIEVVSAYGSKSHYGTYAIDGNALTINISDKTYAGVILDDGASIELGDDDFIDWTEHIKDTDPLLDKFK